MAFYDRRRVLAIVSNRTEENPTDTRSKWLPASTSVIVFLLLLVVGGVRAGLSLPLVSSSSTPKYLRIESMPMGDTMPGLAVDAASSTFDWCRINETPYLGITYLIVTDALAKYYGIERPGGLFVTEVEVNSPAARAGIRPHDIILAFDGQPITPDQPLVFLLMQRQIGDNVTLTLIRRNELREVRVTLAKPPPI